jgi:5'-nucleotidase
MTMTTGETTPMVAPGAPTIDVATVDFLARGGDQYPFRGADFTTLGVTYQQALLDFIESPGDLDELISDEDYPEGGEGRITTTGTGGGG